MGIAQLNSKKQSQSTQSASDAIADVKRWIIDQSRSGKAAKLLHETLVKTGWDPAQVSELMVECFQSAFPGYLRNPNVSMAHPSPVPEPLIPEGARFLEVGDRRVELVMTVLMPRVIVMDDFLSGTECDQLVELARPKMVRSDVVEPVTGMSVANDVRTSTGMFFEVGQKDPHGLVDRIERRIATLLHWPVSHGEGMQVLNYSVNAQYKPHHDYFDPLDPGSSYQLGFAGQRVGTLLMYLNTPECGGGTAFPEGGIEVQAKKGRAVFFSYCMPSAQFRSLHAGMPVIEGEKWVATKWLRQRSFVSINAPRPNHK